MLRWPLPLAIVALMAVPASAADQSVTATPGSSFSPAEVTIDPGEKVTWSNGGGFHNVKFDNGAFEEPAEPSLAQWTVERTFDAPGHYRYYCEAHGGPNGAGMSGSVHVRDTEGPSRRPGLTVSAPARQSLGRLLQRGLRPRVACESGCDATLTLSLDARTAKRFGFRSRRTRIGTASVSLAPDASTRVAVRLTRRARRKVRDAERRFAVRLDVGATQDGRTDTARRTVEITP